MDKSSGVISPNIDSLIGSFVNIYNSRMSLSGVLSRTNYHNPSYILRFENRDGYYIFKTEEIEYITYENSTMIKLKEDNYEKPQ